MSERIGGACHHAIGGSTSGVRLFHLGHSTLPLKDGTRKDKKDMTPDEIAEACALQREKAASEFTACLSTLKGEDLNDAERAIVEEVRALMSGDWANPELMETLDAKFEEISPSADIEAIFRERDEQKN